MSFLLVLWEVCYLSDTLRKKRGIKWMNCGNGNSGSLLPYLDCVLVCCLTQQSKNDVFLAVWSNAWHQEWWKGTVGFQSVFYLLPALDICKNIANASSLISLVCSLSIVCNANGIIEDWIKNNKQTHLAFVCNCDLMLTMSKSFWQTLLHIGFLQHLLVSLFPRKYENFFCNFLMQVWLFI